MSDRLRRWLLPPRLSADPGRLEQARRSIWFTLIMAAAAFSFSPLYVLLGSPAAAISLVVAASLGVASVFATLRYAQSSVAAGNVLVLYTVAAVVYLCTRTGGGGTMLLGWLMLTPLLAVALAGPHSAVAWAALSIAAMSIILLSDAARSGFVEDLSPEDMRTLELLSLSGLVLCALALALVFRASEAALRADLDQSRRAAHAANSAKSVFLANMSHEIRTPMTAVLGYADLLLGTLHDPEHLESVRTIKRNGEHLLEIINDILDLSKIESGRLGVELGRWSPVQIVEEVVALMRVRAEAKKLSLEVEYATPTPETIQTDALRLRQVLLNLIGNAIKFTETGGVRLVVRLLDAEGQPPRMQFEVVDSGIGLSRDQRARLFQPFVQADAATTRRFGGSGLGLAISQRLAEMLGGSIAVASEAGRGSTFSVVVETGPLDGIPLVREPVRPTHAPVPTPAFGPEPPLRARVLLAEDGPDNQRLISFLLRKAGAEVTTVADGQAAVDAALAAQAEGCPFDVILMDMQMPVLDGYAATRRLRQARYAAPIVALTAHAMSSDRQHCLEAGCDEYASKPIDRARLLELVRSFATGSLRSAAP